MGLADSDNTFWKKSDNRKMLRHVVAMAGASTALVVCLQASTFQSGYAYADELATDELAPNAIEQVENAPLPSNSSEDAGAGLSSSNAAADESSSAASEPSTSLQPGYKQEASSPSAADVPSSGENSAAEAPSAALPSSKEPAESPTNETETQEPEPAPIPDKVEDGAYSIISALGTTLEVSGAATDNGGNVQTWNDNQSAAQRFHIKAEGQAKSGEWYYSITNVNSGKALDCVAGGTESGTNVQQYSQNGTGAQQWFLRSATDASGKTYYQIVNVRSGLALDVLGGSSQAGANVQIYSPNGTAAQHWFLKKWIREVADGAYTIVSGLDASYVIDISGASGDDCAAAQIYKSNGTLAQTFAVNYDEYSGYYTITSYASGKRLDVTGGSAQEGALVQQYGANGTRAQLWNIVKNADGSVTFISAINGHALDVMWGAAQNCTRLQQWGSNGSAAQKFFLKEAAPVFGGGLVEIRNGANSYVVMDIPSASKNAGVGVQLYNQNRTFAQKYMVESDGEGSYYIRNIASGLYISVDKNGAVTQQKKDASLFSCGR